jgi:hypothetical protein
MDLILDEPLLKWLTDGSLACVRLGMGLLTGCIGFSRSNLSNLSFAGQSNIEKPNLALHSEHA